MKNQLTTTTTSRVTPTTTTIIIPCLSISPYIQPCLLRPHQPTFSPLISRMTHPWNILHRSGGGAQATIPGSVKHQFLERSSRLHLHKSYTKDQAPLQKIKQGDLSNTAIPCWKGCLGGLRWIRSFFHHTHLSALNSDTKASKIIWIFGPMILICYPFYFESKRDRRIRGLCSPHDRLTESDFGATTAAAVCSQGRTFLTFRIYPDIGHDWFRWCLFPCWGDQWSLDIVRGYLQRWFIPIHSSVQEVSGQIGADPNVLSRNLKRRNQQFPFVILPC